MHIFDKYEKNLALSEQASNVQYKILIWLSVGWPLWNICVTNDHGYVPLVVNTSRSFPHSRLTTGCVTRLTRRVPLVEQELFTLPEHLSSHPVLSGLRVTRSLFYMYFLYIVVCPFVLFLLAIVLSVVLQYNGFWLPLWYLQTLLIKVQ
jgi:hypothetical protein